jgi:hypothetical protein
VFIVIASTLSATATITVMWLAGRSLRSHPARVSIAVNLRG